MDLETRLLHDPQDRPVDLSDGEFRLLRALVQHPRRVLTRDQLVQYALGAESDSYDRAIDVQISRLRRKLASGETRADLIRTVRNEGYMFVPAVTRTHEALNRDHRNTVKFAGNAKPQSRGFAFITSTDS